MADRVYPLQELSLATESTESETKPLHPSFRKPSPPPGTYIIQVPKDQILRVPPPAHAKKIRKFQNRPKTRRVIKRSCLAVTSAILVLILAAAVSVAVIYLVFKPRFPSYSLDSVSVTGLNTVNVTDTVSPVIDAVVHADNSANKMVGIEYRDNGNIAVLYNGVVGLGNGRWPAFYQGPKNVTVFSTALKGEGVILTASERQEMATQQSNGAVPLTVVIDVPVRVMFGKLTTWTIPVKVRCDVTVSSLTAKAAVTSESCSVKAKVFFWWW